MGDNKFFFFAIFHRLIYILPLIILLVLFLWFFRFESIVYWAGILAFIYLLFFTIQDAFLKARLRIKDTREIRIDFW
jgi:hypothetical protein